MKKLSLLVLALFIGTLAALASKTFYPPVGVCCGESETICKKAGNTTLYGPFTYDICP